MKARHHLTHGLPRPCVPVLGLTPVRFIGWGRQGERGSGVGLRCWHGLRHDGLVDSGVRDGRGVGARSGGGSGRCGVGRFDLVVSSVLADGFHEL